MKRSRKKRYGGVIEDAGTPELLLGPGITVRKDRWANGELQFKVSGDDTWRRLTPAAAQEAGAERRRPRLSAPAELLAAIAKAAAGYSAAQSSGERQGYADQVRDLGFAYDSVRSSWV